MNMKNHLLTHFSVILSAGLENYFNSWTLE